MGVHCMREGTCPQVSPSDSSASSLGEGPHWIQWVWFVRGLTWRGKRLKKKLA